MKAFNVLSVFDGCAMTYPALLRIGIDPNRIKYYSSEIDKYAMYVSKKRVPNLINLNDIRIVTGYNFPMIDIFIWEYVRILNEMRTYNPDVQFLLENVASMRQADRDIITEALGVEPIEINSELLSWQNRNRLYWTNIPNYGVPKDLGISLSSVLEPTVDDKYYVPATNVTWKENINNPCIELAYQDKPVRVGTIGNGGMGNPYNYFEKSRRQLVFKIDGKLVSYRKLTPLECERLQTLPDGWTAINMPNGKPLSDSQRFKMIGNGYTVDVIAHLLKGMKI